MATKKKAREIKDRVYRIKGSGKPASTTISSKGTKRKPLLFFDKSKGVNRAIRYAKNQKSIFEDEQDGNLTMEPIVFRDSMLRVPKENQILQEFLDHHPKKGIKFEEIDNERDAQEELDKMDMMDEARDAARSIPVDQLESIARVVLDNKRDISRMTTAEIKRDLRVHAANDPEGFLTILRDPSIKMKAMIHSFFDADIVRFRNQQREVFWNTDNKSRIIAFDASVEDPYLALEKFFRTDEGEQIYSALEAILEKMEK